MLISVIGASDSSPEELQLAEEVGRELAKRGAILICGGRGGVMDPNYYYSSAGAEGAWTEPVNIAKKVNKIGLFPSLTPDRKYMIYFEGGDYFWFDIGAVMEELVGPVAEAAAASGLRVPVHADLERKQPRGRQEPEVPEVSSRSGGELPPVERVVVHQELEIFRRDDRCKDPAPPGDHDALSTEPGTVQRVGEVVAELDAVDACHARYPRTSQWGSMVRRLTALPGVAAAFPQIDAADPG